MQLQVEKTLKDAPGTLVWAYRVGVDQLFMTYSIHDSTYHFYNIPPGTYTVFSEVWVGENLHYTLDTVNLPEGETAHNLVLK
ncbi:MAG: hypothetical protein JSV36_15910 [Anaerolineae bacterium]|nr:MAG: hypothetical protein JSV36_15910 [Anaerolineae bacterium]